MEEVARSEHGAMNAQQSWVSPVMSRVLRLRRQTLCGGALDFQLPLFLPTRAARR